VAQQTTLPTRPQKKSAAEQQIWTVWAMLQYFINSVYDTFVNTVYTPFVAKFALGSATVAAGTTTVVVTHGLNLASYAVSITPTGNNPGAVYWITAKTPTQFTINLSVAAPAGTGAPFDWIVKAV
jgi:hypothetical protein